MAGSGDPVARVEEWIKGKGLEWRVLRLGRRVRTVSEAAEAVGTEASRILKTLIVVGGGRVFAVVLRGDTRLCTSKLERLAGVSGVRLATRSEVEALTGYKAGGVPPAPLPEGVEVIVDSMVLEIDRAYAGGGSEDALVELRPRDLVEALGARVGDVSGCSK